MSLKKIHSGSSLIAAFLLTRMLATQNVIPDLVLLHGLILKVDANDSIAQAAAIRLDEGKLSWRKGRFYGDFAPCDRSADRPKV